MANPIVLHETPSRLRVRLPGLAGCDPAWLESWLEAMPGVSDVRINRKASCVAVAFDPKRAGREAVLARLKACQPGPASGASLSLAGEIAPMLTRDRKSVV